MQELLGVPSGSVVAVFASMLFLSSMALWVLSDAMERRRRLPYDFGSFVFFASPLVVPIYLFSTRGWRALLTIGIFGVLYVVAMILGSIPVMLRSVDS